jgi:uncharacterized protein DUF4276
VAKRIACVVEGHGDVEAVPIVIRRIAGHIEEPVIVQVTVPVRTPKSKLVKPGELERAVEFAARRIGGEGGVLVVLDSDDDCPAVTGPNLLARAAGVRSGLPVGVVLAKREFESWFLAAAESLAGKVGLPVGLQSPANPESIRGAKEWLTDRMIGSRSYSPTLDQPVMAREFDLDGALRAGSFKKFLRETSRLLSQVPDT